MHNQYTYIEADAADDDDDEVVFGYNSDSSSVPHTFTAGGHDYDDVGDADDDGAGAVVVTCFLAR